MNIINKRKEKMEDADAPKRVKMECSYGDKCFRRNPAHFREFKHPHLEAILDIYDGKGAFPIPSQYLKEKEMIQEQLQIILDKQIYALRTSGDQQSSSSSTCKVSNVTDQAASSSKTSTETSGSNEQGKVNLYPERRKNLHKETPESSEKETVIKKKDSDYRPIVPPAPTRRAEQFLKVVLPAGKMAAKHAARAPYYIFYTTITDAKETHNQSCSITFLELLDSSLGELKCSLQINFMVDPGWLLAQYYFAGYSEKKLTILYGEDEPLLRNINQKKPQVDSHMVQMSTPFGKHHTKMMILCYEDGSLRVVVSTANLYADDWENRTQGLWLSPRCPPLAEGSPPHSGESPTMFKRSLLRYLEHYHLTTLKFYIERVQKCDFSEINVFLVASVPGGHFDLSWGMLRAGSLFAQHAANMDECSLIAQASSIGSYGKDPKLWLTSDFLHNFSKHKEHTKGLMKLPDLKIMYPSLENVRQSHDGLLGGGCLPYAAEAHTKQTWLNNFLYQWKATSTGRNRAMPHIKSYLRVSDDGSKASYFLLTSANISKAAWGTINKGNGAHRIMSYEAGVLFLPSFVINEDYFPLKGGGEKQLILPYDVPPTKYTSDMSPWVSDYLS